MGKCSHCGKVTIRIENTICGVLCEKCIREIRERLAGSLAIIRCKGRGRMRMYKLRLNLNSFRHAQLSQSG